MPNPHPVRPIVLLVDDNADVRLSFRFMLEVDEFQVVEAASGASALALMGQVTVDLVLTDIYMPGEPDGIGLIQAIRKRPTSQPAILAMSGEPHLDYRSSLEAARHAGADATLTKPFTRADLLNAIRKALGADPNLVIKRPSNPSRRPEEQ